LQRHRRLCPRRRAMVAVTATGLLSAPAPPPRMPTSVWRSVAIKTPQRLRTNPRASRATSSTVACDKMNDGGRWGPGAPVHVIPAPPPPHQCHPHARGQCLWLTLGLSADMYGGTAMVPRQCHSVVRLIHAPMSPSPYPPARIRHPHAHAHQHAHRRTPIPGAQYMRGWMGETYVLQC
jgi:hypothetical protein